MAYQEDIIIERMRQEYDGDEPIQTIGGLYIPGKSFTCMTLELPWKDNKQNVSCIPPMPGEQKVYDWKILKSSPSFNYPHLYITGVKDRTYIKVHAGNSYDQILGCVLVGDSFDYLPGDKFLDVLNSRDTLEKLIDALGKTEGTLRIINRST